MSSDHPVNLPPPSTPSPGPPTPPPPAAAAPSVAPTYVPVVETKSPALAGLLSMFPGLGHLYLGLYQRAFAFGGGVLAGGEGSGGGAFVSLTSRSRSPWASRARSALPSV